MYTNANVCNTHTHIAYLYIYMCVCVCTYVCIWGFIMNFFRIRPAIAGLVTGLNRQRKGEKTQLHVKGRRPRFLPCWVPCQYCRCQHLVRDGRKGGQLRSTGIMTPAECRPKVHGISIPRPSPLSRSARQEAALLGMTKMS